MLPGPDDTYCRGCGRFLGGRRLPAVVDARPPAPARNGHRSPSVPVRQVAAAVAVGAALQVGLGLAGKSWALHRAARRARSLLPARRERTDRSAPRQSDGGIEVTEVIVVRRWRSRRGD